MPPGAGSIPSARKIFCCSGSARVALRTCKVRPSLRLKVAVSFLQVLLLAKELKLLRVGLVSVDGSKFKANASKHRSATYERAGGLIG